MEVEAEESTITMHIPAYFELRLVLFCTFPCDSNKLVYHLRS